MIVKVNGETYSEICEIHANKEGKVVLMQAMCPQGNPIKLEHEVTMEVIGENDI